MAVDMFRGPDHIAIRRGVRASTGQVLQDTGSRPVYRLREPLTMTSQHRPSDDATASRTPRASAK